MKSEEVQQVIGSINDLKEAIKNNKPAEIQKVKIVTDPYDFAKPLNDNSSSGTAATKPQTPNITLENPLQRDVRITGLSLILDSDATKRAKLLVEILINGVEYFDRNKANFFKNMASFAVPISNEGHKLMRDNKIEIFLWSSDGTDIEVAASALLQGRPQG